MDENFLSTLEAKVCQKVLRASVYWVFYNKDELNRPRLFVGFVQISSRKSLASFKGSKVITEAVHTVLLGLREAYRSKHIKFWDGVMAFPLLVTENIGSTKDA